MALGQIAEFLEAMQANNAKAEAFVVDQNAKLLDAVSAMDNVDYDRIVDEMGDKMLEVLGQIQANTKKQEVVIDYDRIIYGVTEKVVESMPAPEKIDYERLADLVVNKMSAGMAKTTEVVFDEAGICELADKVAAKLSCNAVDYDRISQIVETKIAEDDAAYEFVLDEEGMKALAQGVSEEICRACENCELEVVETVVPVEEVVEEVVEETPVEETVEEVVEEAPVEERPTVEEELAATAALIQEVGNDLVDAETGLVIRLKRSFTAKMKQSEEKVKSYYSDLKNELVSYKKINSNVSWHGDRFNFGRDTVAKININGKTLCFYLALDPNDPEFKETVYHQKDVSGQKAYENTPFMVKVKSDAAVKKALRLVGSLAEKLGTEKEENFAAVDYVDEFAYASTKKLFDEGFIKATGSSDNFYNLYKKSDAYRDPDMTLPSPALSDGSLDFSFSGLKTAAINLLHRFEQAETDFDRALFAARYTYEAVEAVKRRIGEALDLHPDCDLVLAGGVAANSHLRAAVGAACKKAGGHDLYRRSCDKRRYGCRSKSVGTYGGYSTLF